MNDGIRQQENSQHEYSLARSIVWTICTTFAHFIAALVLMGVMCEVVPRCIKVFCDFDAELPATTQLLIRLSDVVVNYCYLFPLGLLLDGAILFCLSRLPARARWLATAWFGAVLLAAVVFLAYVSIAICQPMTGLHESLS
ncbi:MAG: hypothetical protein HQ567_12065 [Candidatus Nealsonbacteria bacterium]|nr:hypothetical protein [Candidatus Nealsonbacteria bacterium]